MRDDGLCRFCFEKVLVTTTCPVCLKNKVIANGSVKRHGFETGCPECKKRVQDER